MQNLVTKYEDSGAAILILRHQVLHKEASLDRHMFRVDLSTVG